MPHTVTFDSNTLAAIANPEHARASETFEAANDIHNAIKNGVVQGVFSETYLTIDRIKKGDRSDVFGNTKLVTSWAPSNGNNATLNINVTHPSKPIPQIFEARVSELINIGFKVLMSPRSFISRCAKDFDFFGPPATSDEFIKCIERACDLHKLILQRGVGAAVAMNLGNKWNHRDKITNALFVEGLIRARNKIEEDEMQRAVREWADGDTVASHYGFGIEFLCTRDKGDNSIFSTNSRAWLSQNYRLEFVTLPELARKIAN